MRNFGDKSALADPQPNLKQALSEQRSRVIALGVASMRCFAKTIDVVGPVTGFAARSVAEFSARLVMLLMLYPMSGVNQSTVLICLSTYFKELRVTSYVCTPFLALLTLIYNLCIKLFPLDKKLAFAYR